MSNGKNSILTKSNKEKIKDLVVRALREDINRGDITTKAIIPKDLKCRAFIFSRERGIICGLPIIKMVFKVLGGGIIFKEILKEGEYVSPNQRVAEISGDARGILAGERVALNFLQKLSGIATYTNKFVRIANQYNVKILDTRKTTPGLRILEKYAVRVGGGENHRFGLWDRILIKGNHINLVGLKTAIEAARKTKKTIEVEVRDINEVKEAVNLGVNIIMLDNMDIKTINKAIKIINKKALIEVSGGVNLKNIREIARLRPDWISIGRLTYSAGILDMSLRVEKQIPLFTERTYVLPSDMREGLRKPVGVAIFGGKEEVLKKFKRFIRKKRFKKIITVGDYCSFNIPSDVKIFDGKVRRKKIKKKFPYSIIIKNPAGTIQKEVWKKIQGGISKGENIFIKGEEDLLVIPSVLTAPGNSLVVYGLPGKGICLIDNSEKNKFIIRNILEKFVSHP